MSTKNIQDIKNRIESMSIYHQKEILKILSENKVSLNENNNGTFVNLTDTDKSIIEKINVYIRYVDEQENELNEVENEKDRIQNKFFNDNKE
tara:strand:+ start:4840 stop:5115 length:276 start_codon:yes stop_codon:yes gene_type:complete